LPFFLKKEEGENKMATLDLWKDPWPLNEQQCPCDVHFMQFLSQSSRKEQRIFHFGTGDHHHVGIEAAKIGHSVLGVTATDHEYQSYIRLVIENPHLGKAYKVLFSDIYQTNLRLLPRFEIVTLFHLCEFWSEHNAPFAALDDRGVLHGMAKLVESGGLMMFYTGSFAYAGAAKLLETFEKEAGFVEEAPAQTLRVFRKIS
jgi:hypothetical protein